MDPTFLIAGRLFDNRPASDSSALLCIYRERHAANVEKLVASAIINRMEVVLWALDAPSPRLSSWTIGTGAGPRMSLLNRLYHAIPSSSIDQLVVVDDDVIFTRGTLSSLLKAANVCDFGIAQPAHAPGSCWNHMITKRRGLTLARLTSFVEIGPVFVVSGKWVSRIIPFPEDFGMGWGLELLWQDLRHQGCNLGIIDGICIEHPAPPREYDLKAERNRLMSMLKSRGLNSIEQTQFCLGTWRPWNPEPPW